jgi:thioredoxin reductase (NADPH)
MLAQVTKNGAEIVYDSAESIEIIEGGFRVKGGMSGDHEAKMILLSTGMEHRHLNVPGEKEFYGKGVTYCATCDGMFYKGLDVAIVGGGNTAAESALYLADICTSVRVFIRKDHFRADPILVEKVMSKENIIVEFETQISEIQGEEKLSQVVLSTGKTREIQGLFIEIGSDPRNDLAKSIGVEVNDQGYIVVDSKQRTNIPNILAAGDNTTGSDTFAQIATAVGEGAVAAKTAYNLFQHF